MSQEMHDFFQLHLAAYEILQDAKETGGEKIQNCCYRAKQ